MNSNDLAKENEKAKYRDHIFNELLLNEET